MCNLCTKVQALDSVSSQTIEPVMAALARLHTTNEPLLGDLWLSKHAGIFTVRKALKHLHKKAPSSRLDELLEEVDGLITICVEQLARHQETTPRYAVPAHLREQRAVEEYGASKADESDSDDSITPSQSASARVRKWRAQLATAEVCISDRILCGGWLSSAKRETEII